MGYIVDSSKIGSNVFLNSMHSLINKPLAFMQNILYPVKRLVITLLYTEQNHMANETLTQQIGTTIGALGEIGLTTASVATKPSTPEWEKIVESMDVFLNYAPPVVAAFDPVAGALAMAIAAGLKAIAGGFASYEAAKTPAAATAPTA